MFEQSHTQPQLLNLLPHSTLHLLIVEDVAADAELMVLALESAGVNLTWEQVKTAQDCEQMLGSNNYDAVLADFRLPSLNGFDVLRLVEQSGQEIPFILVTGSLGEEAAVECIKAGMTDYVLKDRLFRLPIVLKRALAEFELRRQQKEAIALSQRQAQRETIINKIVQAMRATLALDEVMQITVDQLQTALQTSRCLICRLEGDNQTIIRYASINTADRENVLGVHCEFSPIHYENLSQGETVILSELSNLPLQVQEVFKLFEIRSLAIIPLLYRNSFLGVISVHQCDRAREWNPEELSLAKAIADRCAIAIHQAELYQKAQVELAERKRAEAALRQSEQRFRSLIENATDITVILSARGKYKYISPSVKRILGYSPSSAIGRSALTLAHPDDKAAIAQTLSKAIQNPGISLPQIEYRVRHRNANTWCVLEGVATNLLHDKAVNGIVVNCHDITDRKLAEEQLLHDAFHDTLTGLPNRALFNERLDHALTVAKRRKDYLFAVLFLDLDRFKVVNDSLGHSIGDRLLIAIARRLQNTLRPGDTVARLGGDEFVILLEDIESLTSATNLANLLHQELTIPIILDTHEIFITASIGIALSSPDGEDAANLLRYADTAMYRAKEKGRSRHEVFNTSMHDHALRMLQLENDLRRAIETIKKQQYINKTPPHLPNSQLPITNSQFLIHYQPIISLSTGSITGFEALVRWQHPERGLISPAEFIPVAEETGLIVPIGKWVLRESCRQIRQWQQQFPHRPPLTVSVNLSVKQFSQPDLIDQIDQILLETNLDGLGLKLEITESVLMENSESVTTLLEELRARNIHLCIDDFGTGYSSLSYLHRFPTNTLKIDRSFISRMGIDFHIRKGTIDPTEIVRSIITLAHNLGMDVVAEGIEEASQLALLKALKCDGGQGYFFSRPVDSEAAAALIAKDEGNFDL